MILKGYIAGPGQNRKLRLGSKSRGTKLVCGGGKGIGGEIRLGSQLAGGAVLKKLFTERFRSMFRDPNKTSDREKNWRELYEARRILQTLETLT